MSWQLLTEHTAHSPEVRVVAAHDGHGHARLDVTTDGRGSADGGRLVCQAIHEARMCSAHHVEFALNAAVPACGVILAALQADTGDVESIEMRRAGSSVMVRLELKPLSAEGAATGGAAVPGPRPGRRRTGVLQGAAGTP